MNLFYETAPTEVTIGGIDYPIVTDFRDCISLIDMLKDNELKPLEKYELVMERFTQDKPADFKAATEALTEFINMECLPRYGMNTMRDGESEEEPKKKNLFSFSIDYPCILAGFMHDYKIDLSDIEYMHWWKFRMLFDNLSEDTEIKQRIYYRGVDLGTIKDKEERKRIARIQQRIKLPDEELSDYDIGDAFA